MISSVYAWIFTVFKSRIAFSGGTIMMSDDYLIGMALE